MKFVKKIFNYLHRKKEQTPDKPNSIISQGDPAADSEIEMQFFFGTAISKTPKKYQLIDKEITVTESGSKILTMKIEISDVEED